MQGRKWFGDDQGSEAFAYGSVSHAISFEVIAAEDLPVKEDCIEYYERLPGAPFGDWVQREGEEG